jgi:hypothetical protein
MGVHVAPTRSKGRHRAEGLTTGAGAVVSAS